MPVIEVFLEATKLLISLTETVRAAVRHMHHDAELMPDKISSIGRHTLRLKAKSQDLISAVESKDRRAVHDRWAAWMLGIRELLNDLEAFNFYAVAVYYPEVPAHLMEGIMRDYKILQQLEKPNENLGSIRWRKRALSKRAEKERKRLAALDKELRNLNRPEKLLRSVQTDLSEISSDEELLDVLRVLETSLEKFEHSLRIIIKENWSLSEFK